MILLTQSTTPIIGQVAWALGQIMNALFEGLNSIGVANIGVAIILFTFVIKFLMLPLTVKQQKFTKLTNVMNPELQVIQKKYKDKKDQESVMKMNEEQKAIYAKYGTSPTGGCIQLVIQMPILFALYRVIQSIPAYVPRLKNLFLGILGNDTTTGIMSDPDFAKKMTDNFSVTNKIDLSNSNSVIDFMNTFSTDNWSKLQEVFPNYADVITSNVEQINHMNNFLGVNMSQNPGFVFGLPILIPIFAALTQWLSTKMMQNPQQMDDDNPAAASMKMMTVFMPIMSGFLAISLPAGLGIYWIATAVFQIVMQWGINRYFDRLGVDKLVQKNIERSNKKREKKGLPPQKIAANANVKTSNKDMDRINKLQEKKQASDEKVKDILEKSSDNKRSSSLAEKAAMVSKYNEKNNKK